MQLRPLLRSRLWRRAFSVQRPSPLAVSVEEAGTMLRGLEHSKAMWDGLRAGENPLGARSPLLPRALERASGAFAFPAHEVTGHAVSACGTHKLLLKFGDGLAVETVLIPMQGTRGEVAGELRSTLCISTQVGCAQACRFCATGAMGRRRSLRTDEILAQVWQGIALSRERGLPPVRNIVYMGMGEALDNVAAVEASLRSLTHQRGFGIAPRHLTVSTVGPSPEAILATRGWPARLAWSVHAADDTLRKQLVRSARFPVARLRDAFCELVTKRKPLLVQATLIDGVNDSAGHAREMAELLRPLARVTVNLIPYNVTEGLDAVGAAYQPASAEAVQEYRRVLMGEGFICTTRAQRGADEAAACGMLATVRRQRRSAG